ncbi:hypothetical protein CDO52_16415 [Nocardiopsis gilva YIM 90087]|uniref:Integrase n=1 Tax=Nocardiopsis gilva YIM 90087 TaxID=1235441 RepID=A0A223S7Q4_9ACTN|nr:hypothetical protein [Nocardiopsis gilva]ASU84161.1 hypothetical protein CDO52_16415 [Nocardiopsis gilva YIM 90087]
MSDLLAGATPINEVSRWVGYDFVTTTRRIYGHEVPSSFSRGLAFLANRYERLIAGQDPAVADSSWLSADEDAAEHEVPGLAA